MTVINLDKQEMATSTLPSKESPEKTKGRGCIGWEARVHTNLLGRYGRYVITVLYTFIPCLKM